MPNPSLGELFTQTWQKIDQMKLHVCLSGEYNVTTLVPTVDYPEENTFYLVPDGTGNNVYTEWVYVNDNWERFGQASIDLSDYVQKTDYATYDNPGIVAVNAVSYGIGLSNEHELFIREAASSNIKNGSISYSPIVPKHQHEAVFYGLAKAAGDTTQASSDNAVGTYTADAQAAIQSMLGIGTATDSTAGLVKVMPQRGIGLEDGSLILTAPNNAQLKTLTNGYYAVKLNQADKVIFYGLAKAAGDSTQAISDNEVGIYTDDAKTAIRSMIGAAAASDMYIYNEVSGETIVVDNAVAENVKSMQIEIAPTQSGSGDPSPSNIRTISEYTECNITVANGNDSTAQGYDADEYEIEFPVAAGTISGGTIELNQDGTGTIKVTRETVTYDGSSDENWVYTNVNSAGFYIENANVKRLHDYSQAIMSDKLKTLAYAYVTGWELSELCISAYDDHNNMYPNTNWLYVKNAVNVNSSLATFKEWLAENPITVCYELATPVTYTITAPQVKTLLGLNYISADTGDITSLVYAASMANINEEINEIKASLEEGVLPLGELISNTYIKTNGDADSYAGWSSTDYIEVNKLQKVLRITSTTASNGNYNAFYNASKTFISSFSISAGTNDISVPYNAAYVRLSNTTASLSTYIIESLMGYLSRKAPGLKPSIEEYNSEANMYVNAGANYGHHASGVSNVDKRFSILITTDPHYDTEFLSRAINYLNNMPCFDCGVTLGDMQNNTFSDSDGTWYTNIIKYATKDWFTVIGNHDVGIGNTIAATGTNEQVYNKFIAPNLQYCGVTPDGENYYYKDYSSYKIRVICLNCYDVDDTQTNGTDYVVPRYTEYYSQDQIDWFVGLLKDTPSDYHVLVMVHNTPGASTQDTNVHFNNHIYSFSPETTQGGIITEIVDAWQQGTSLQKTYTCTNANLSSVSVDEDFTSRGVGHLICFLTGHMHTDAIGYITAYNNQNVFTFASTNAGTYQNNWSDLPRVDGTKSEDCITALSVDTTAKKIYITRIGSNISNTFEVREPSVISYT